MLPIPHNASWISYHKCQCDIIELTYQAAGMFPRSIFIDPDHDSPEERARLILADLEAARAPRPSFVQLS